MADCPLRIFPVSAGLRCTNVARMARIPIPSNKWHRVILVLGLIALAVLQANQMIRPAGANLPGHDRPGKTSRPNTGPAERPSRPSSKNGPSAATSAWRTFAHCTLVENRNNDGDSFDLLCDGQKMTVRLYFVDCPEKRRHQYNSPRIADQARYFGCSEKQAIATGVTARDFAEGFLRNDSVTFSTRMEQVFDSGRIYGFISVDGMDMGEALVARGLARIYTQGTDGPAPGTEHDEKERLLKLERDARSRRLGGWQQG